MTDTATATPTFTVPDLREEALAALTLEVGATAEKYDRSAEVPRDGLQAAHRGGYLTATVGKRYGGPGLSLADQARILVALGQGDPSVALIAANNFATHSGQDFAGSWPEAEYARFLELSAAGPAPANTVRAEPELGAPARGGLPATVATRTETGWSVSGRKAYATGGEALAYHLVWVVTDEPDQRVGHIIVPAAATGITWITTWDHLGLRASNTNDVVYDGVEVPFENFLEIPKVNGVYRDPAALANPAALGHAALYVGVAKASLAAFADFARSRVPAALGKPIAETERIQAVAGEVALHVAAAEALLFGTLARVEAGDASVTPQVPLIKVQIARSVTTATQTAVAALGNPALSRSNPLERHLRDSLCIRVHPPQEDTALLAAGRAALAG